MTAPKQIYCQILSIGHSTFVLEALEIICELWQLAGWPITSLITNSCTLHKHTHSHIVHQAVPKILNIL